MQRSRERARHVAAGGWRRALTGLAVGLVAGALVALLLPREPRGGPRGHPVA